jgi:hypothetical protein
VPLLRDSVARTEYAHARVSDRESEKWQASPLVEPEPHTPRGLCMHPVTDRCQPCIIISMTDNDNDRLTTLDHEKVPYMSAAAGRRAWVPALNPSM